MVLASLQKEASPEPSQAWSRETWERRHRMKLSERNSGADSPKLNLSRRPRKAVPPPDGPEPRPPRACRAELGDCPAGVTGILVAHVPWGKRGERPKLSSRSSSPSSSRDRRGCASERLRAPLHACGQVGQGPRSLDSFSRRWWAHSRGPNAFQEASVRPRGGAPPFKCPPSA